MAADANDQDQAGSTTGVVKSEDPETPLKDTTSKRMSWRRRLFSSTSSKLPPGWKLYQDKTTNKVYYANKKTGESSWKRPKLSKQDKKELALKKQLAPEVKRCRSNSTKSSLSTVASIPSIDRKPNVESTQERVHQVEKTVSFSLQDQVCTYHVEPQEKNSPSKKIQSRSRSPSKSKQPVKQLSSPVQPIRSQTKHPNPIRKKKTIPKKEHDAGVKSKSDISTKKLSYKPIKGWKNNSRAEVSSPPPNTKSVPQKSPSKTALIALLGIRGKFHRKSESQRSEVVESTKPDVATYMSKVASLPASPSRKSATRDSVAKAASTSPSKSESLLKKISPSRKKTESSPTSSPTGSSKSSSTRSTSSSSIEWETPVEHSPDHSSTSSLNLVSNIDSSASPQKPVSKMKIANLLKMTPLKSTPSKLQGHELSSLTKITPVSQDDLVKSDASEVLVSNASSESDPEVSDMSERFTSLFGCNDCNAHENDVSEIPMNNSPVVPTAQPMTDEADNGSPASSTLSSSFPLADLMMFDVELEPDDSIKQEETMPSVEKEVPDTPEHETKSDDKGIIISRSPSKIVSAIFKKNRSRDNKGEGLTENAKEEEPTQKFDEELTPTATATKTNRVESTPAKTTPAEPAVVTPPKKHEENCVDTTAQVELSKPKKAEDSDTHSTASSCSGIGAYPLESRWVVDNEDFALVDENVEVQESKCGDCGCSQSLHEQLLFFGGMIFEVVGKPNDDLRATMETAGDFFAEEDEDSIFAEQDSVDVVAEEDSLHDSLASF